MTIDVDAFAGSLVGATPSGNGPSRSPRVASDTQSVEPGLISSLSATDLPAMWRILSATEELGQRWPENRRIDVVLLSLEGLDLRVRHRVGDGLRGRTHEPEARGTDEDQRRDGDRPDPVDGKRVVAHDLGVVRERVRERLGPSPPWLGLRRGDEF